MSRLRAPLVTILWVLVQLPGLTPASAQDSVNTHAAGAATKPPQDTVKTHAEDTLSRRAVEAAIKEAAKRGDLAMTKAAVYYNHGDCTKDQATDSPACTARRKLSLKDGQTFTVAIYNTQKDAFVYSIETVARKEEGNVPQARRAKPPEVKILTLQHDKRYAGYIVHITPTGRASTTLGEARIIIDVTTSEFRVGFGGGFTASGLSDPVFAVVTDSVGDPGSRTAVQRFVREEDREDDARLGLGSFVHVYHTSHPWAALTFGLGIEQNRAASYYLGPSWRMGDAAMLTAGLLVGSIKTAPPGVSEGQIVTDPNVVNTSGSRLKASWFVGLSYSFIGGAQDKLGKPFLGETPTPVAPATPEAQEGSTSGSRTLDAEAAKLVEDIKAPATAAVSGSIKLTVTYKPEAAARTQVKWELQECPEDAAKRPTWNGGEAAACNSDAVMIDESRKTETTVTFPTASTYTLWLLVGGKPAGNATVKVGE
jgi:hypothetical protein